MKKKLYLATVKVNEAVRGVLTRKHRGVDKILVIAGVCIIALLLVAVLNTELGDFITHVYEKLTTKADSILGI